MEATGREEPASFVHLDNTITRVPFAANVLMEATGMGITAINASQISTGMEKLV